MFGSAPTLIVTLGQEKDKKSKPAAGYSSNIKDEVERYSLFQVK
jgi:hypothetical protein